MTNAAPSSSPTDPVPMAQKIAFGFGMLGNQLFPAAVAVFNVVLVQSLKMEPWMAGVLAAAPRVFDAITDPLMGYITDNTKSRWGRRRPYVFIGSILAGVSFALMWQLDAENSMMYNFWYFLLLSLAFYLGLTIFATPYVAMGYEMSDNFHERTQIMAIAQWIGQWAWVIAPWFWIVIFNADVFPDPETGESNGVAGARGLAVWVGGGCILLAMIPAIFCRTKPVDESTLEPLSPSRTFASLASLFRGVFIALRCWPFFRLCTATFLVFGSFQIIAGFAYFIIVHYMFGGSPDDAGRWPTWHGTAGALTTCFLAIPVVAWLAKTFGKKSAFVMSQSASILGYGLFWWCFSEDTPWLLFLPLPLFSFGIGGLFTIMMSMTADVCDLDELNTGARREGIFGAVYWWMVKLGQAVAFLLAGVIMSAIGFDPNAAQQTEEALTGLRLSYIILPSVGAFIAILVMLGYDLDEKRSNEIRAQIEARKTATGGS